MSESPAELLERAAARLEELASKATPGPWDTFEQGHYEEGSRDAEVVTRNEEFVSESDRVGDGRRFVSADADGAGSMTVDDARWISVMSPTAAAPLVALLRATARYVHYERGAVSSPENAKGFFEQKYGAAFDFARLILGEQ